MTADFVKKVTHFGTFFGEFSYLNSSCIRVPSARKSNQIKSLSRRSLDNIGRKLGGATGHLIDGSEKRILSVEL